jgi:UDP-glucose 6-dehydrogenase
LLQNTEFSNKLDSVCTNIGANRNDLIKIMMAESKLDPRIVNKYSNAT